LGEREGEGESEPVAVDHEVCAMVGGDDGVHCRRTIVAPKARLTVYKVCWKEFGCFDSNILAAFDSAVFDSDGTEKGRKKKKQRAAERKKREKGKRKRKEREKISCLINRE
jgi:hypothetical protein